MGRGRGALIVVRGTRWRGVDGFHQVIAKLLGKLGNLHALRNQHLARQNRAWGCAGLARHGIGDSAKLAFLIPAKASVGNSFRTDVLEDPQASVLLGNLEGLSQDRNVDQPFVVAKKRIPHKSSGNRVIR